MKQPYVPVNQPYMMLMCTFALCKVFEVQLYKSNAHELLLHILSVVNSDWLLQVLVYVECMKY